MATGGSQTIQAGGQATGTIVQTGGRETVLVSGTTTSASITGIEIVYGSATSATVNSGGTLRLETGGVASAIVVNSGGSITLEGGTLQSVNLDVGATIDAATLGFTNGEQVSVSSSGVLTVISPDGLSTLATIQLTGNYAGDVFQVTSDGAGGTLIINAGIPAAVDPGSTVSGGVVSAGSPAAVYGTVVDTTIGSGGTQQVNSGGVASGTQVGSGGTQVVSSGGSAVDTVISSGGTQQVGSGGQASGTIVTSGGTEVVQSGGTTVGAFVSAGGTEQIQSGGTMVSGSVDGVTDGTVNVYGGTTIDNTMLWGSIENVYAGGVASGSIINSGGAQAIYSGGVASGTIINSAGIESVLSGGTAINTLVNAGGVETVSLGGSTANVSVAGTETVSGTASNTTILSGGVEEVTSGGNASGVTIQSGGTLVLDDGSTASGITANVGAQIDIANVSYDSGDQVSIDANNVMTITNQNGDTVDVLQLAGANTQSVYTVANDGHGGLLLTRAICYLRGTAILTPTGLVNVEDMKIGDSVVTRFGGVQPIRWIGRQSYEAKTIADNREQIPVRFRRGSLGDHLPIRDLYISPGHSMLIGDSLVMAKHLVNGVTVTQDWMPEQVDYFQLELAAHDCVLAEGTWSETYADFEGGRAQFHNAAEFYAMFPNYREPEELTLCAPRPEKGMALAAALRPIVARATRMATPGKLQGYIESVRGDWKIAGWVHDKSHPELPVLVEILLQGKVIGTALACQFREDLLKGKVGTGRAGFVFTSTVKLEPALLATLEVRRAVDGAAVRVASSITAAANTADTVMVKIAG